MAGLRILRERATGKLVLSGSDETTSMQRGEKGNTDPPTIFGLVVRECLRPELLRQSKPLELPPPRPGLGSSSARKASKSLDLGEPLRVCEQLAGRLRGRFAIHRGGL